MPDASRVAPTSARSRFWRSGGAVFIFFAWLVALSGQTPPAAEERTLLVGITGPEPRYVSAEQAHLLDRFEVELTLALARAQGMKISFRLAPLDQLLNEVADGRVDFMPGIARTPDRQKIFDFTVPHSHMPTNLFVRRDEPNIHSAADLPGKDIIVVTNSYSYHWARQHANPRRLVVVPDVTEALRHLSRGDGDALVVKQLNVYAAMREAGVTNVELRGPPVPGLTQDLCCVVRIGNRDLLAQLNEATFTLKQTGELDRIYEKWIGVYDPGVTGFTRYRRAMILGAAALAALVVITWSLNRVQRRRVKEIESRVAERTEELAAAKARFEEVVACTPAGIVIVDPHDAEVPGRIVDCNELFCRMHGYEKNELIKSSINQLQVTPFDRKALATIAAEIESGRRRHGQTRHRRKDDSVIEVEFYSTFIRLDGRNLVLIVNLDITDRLRAETALRRTEEFQRLVLRATNDGIFEWDITGDRFHLSDRGWQMLGYAENELPGSRLGWWQRLHPDDVQDAEAALWRHIVEGAPFVHTARYLHKDGSVRWFYCRANTLRDPAGQPVRMVGSYTDITELKRIDGELQLTRRLRAIGELVGGIAHEFNNLLTPILLRASEVSQRDDMPPTVVSELQPVLDAARRAQTLTQQLLQFGRRGNGELVSQPLANVVESTLQLMRSTVDRRIEIREECDPNLPPLQHNTAIMGQVVMNLVLNARDALLEKLARSPAPDWRPEITVHLKQHVGPARHTVALPEAQPRRWQRLTVEDNGPGIPPEIRERIFEPFFTTKDVGQGTGLGLAMVWNSVEEGGGWLEVDSVLGEGTQFHLFLPEIGAEESLDDSEIAPPPPAHHAGPRELLYVEDDELVGGAVSALLRRLGHNVEWLRSGEEALTRLRGNGQGFDALLTDLNMPGIGGEELVEQVREGGYRGKIMVFSGRITRESETRLRAAGVDVMVQKPFEFAQIAEILENLWSAPSSSAPGRVVNAGR